MEICVDSLESAANAVEGRATRLEVCSALSEGGLTPTPGLFKAIKESTSPYNVELYAMIRVRSGNFVYSEDEMNCMLHDVDVLKTLNPDGFVFGALTADGDIDKDACSDILYRAGSKPVTFHRAFDEVSDPFNALRVITDLGFERILTSGLEDTAEQGVPLITQLIFAAKRNIIIMPGSGITPDNIMKIKILTGAKEFHASARKKKEQSTQNKVKIATQPYLMVTDTEMVRAMVEHLGL